MGGALAPETGYYNTVSHQHMVNKHERFHGIHNLQIDTNHEWSMRPQCENDTMLMECFASRGVSCSYRCRQ